MTLCAVTDAFLAVRAANGEGVAFAELARRYRPLMQSARRRHGLGLDAEDARQEALIGLFEACRGYEPARGRFAGLASLRVHSRVGNAGKTALAHKHRILTEAVRDGDEPTRRLAERSAAPEGADPALVVELRDELRQHAQAARRRADAPGSDLRRRHSDAQIAHALALVADGASLCQAAAAVGAHHKSVGRWLTQAA